MKKFKRMNEAAMFGGVLSGIAYKYDIATWKVRVAFVAALILLEEIFGGVPLILGYVLLFGFAPEYETDPSDYKEICE